MKYKFLFVGILWMVIHSCSQPSTEKYQKSRDNIVNVKAKIVEIPMDSVLCNNMCAVYMHEDKFIITDSKSFDLQIHIFDKRDFTHLVSTAPHGQGPAEIANMGPVLFSDSLFFVEDFGKFVFFKYNIDSLLHDPDFVPQVAYRLNGTEFPVRTCLLNDTIAYSIIMKPTGTYGFNQYTAKWNLQTGEFVPLTDLHPEIKTKRYKMAISLRYNLLVENYHRQNLLVIRNLDDGSLKYNIRGDEPSDGWQRHVEYFELLPQICKDKIVCGYKGESTDETPENPLAAWGTKLILFTLDGDYIQTLETGYRINDFCYDEEMNRIIFSFNDDIQFGYLDMNGIM